MKLEQLKARVKILEETVIRMEDGLKIARQELKEVKAKIRAIERK
jgi:hypothetical protein